MRPRIRTAGWLLAATIAATALTPLAAPGAPEPRADIDTDFNGDGFADLAIGAPGAGMVTILYGSAQSLTTAIAHGVTGSPEGRYGSALAVGDFDGDGFDDLAIGEPEAPGKEQGESGAGAVHVLAGTPDGLISASRSRWHQDVPGVKGVLEQGDRFGSALVTGDFDGDGYDDLAIGVPREDHGSVTVDGEGEPVPTPILDAGLVNVLRGSPDGLTAAFDQIWHQDTPGVKGTAGMCPFEDHSFTGENFGASLAAGDLNGDGIDDLAIGVPNESSIACASELELGGGVNVLLGSSGGLTARGDSFWHQDVPHIPGRAWVGDSFGASLAIGDLDGDTYADLAIGVPGEGHDRGEVLVLPGGPAGPSAEGARAIRPAALRTEGSGNRLGESLATGDVDGDDFDELIVGAPGETLQPVAQVHPALSAHTDRVAAGAVYVLAGTPAGPSTAVVWRWTQDSAGIDGSADAHDLFGRHLAVADFDGNGFPDLAMGVPGEESPSNLQVPGEIVGGAVHVLYAEHEGLSAEGSQLWHGGNAGSERPSAHGDGFGVL